MKATRHQAKTQLSRLVEQALAGEEVILTHGRSQTPVARIVPFQSTQPVPPRRERPLGLYAAEMGFGPELRVPLDADEMALWEEPSLVSGPPTESR